MYLLDAILYHLYNYTNRNRRDYSKRLFVCGCPRSGTTAVWRLLTRHPSIGMGVERYINKVDGHFIELTPELFEKQRFFDLQPGDTHFSDLTSDGAGKYYKDLKPRYDKCLWLGDKSPILYKNFNGLFYRFPNAHVFFVVRDVYEVALSFELRKQDQTDNWDLDYKDAVTKWNESISQALKYRKLGNQLFFVDYNDLYYGDYDISILFNWLKLDAFQELHTFHKNERIFSQRLMEKTKQPLDKAQVEYIRDKADFSAFNEIQTMKNKIDLS